MTNLIDFPVVILRFQPQPDFIIQMDSHENIKSQTNRTISSTSRRFIINEFDITIDNPNQAKSAIVKITN